VHRILTCLLLLFVCLMPLSAQSALTQISDTITFPNGTKPNGTALISWARYTNDSNPRQVIYPGSQTIQITNGVVNVRLFPTAAMLPVGCYNVQYSLAGNRSVRYWFVPVSASPVSLNIVESSIGCGPPSTGMIAPAQISNAGAQVGNALVWNGTFWAPGVGSGNGGGGSGSAIYTTAVPNQATVTITAVVHKQGVHPFAIAFRSSDGQDVQAVYTCKTSGGAPVGCADATSNGDMVFNFNPPFSGSIEIGGGGNGNGGGPGNTSANQILGQPITSMLGNSGILVQGIGPYTSGHLGSFDASGNLIDSTIPVANAVLTTGSYADPTWITSLATSKLSGALPCPQEPQFTGDVTKLAGSCATVVLTTNGIGFSPSATIDATNGNNITSGTVAGARMQAINLASSANGGVTGNLNAVNVNGGLNADNTHFLRGDMTWVTVAGAGTVTNSSGPLAAGQLLVGNGANDATAIGTLGSTTTVYHGNAGGTGAFLPVSLTADVSGILPGVNGGTNNAFFAVSGPAASLKTFAFPNVSATVLTTNAAVTMAQGGTGADFSAIAKGGVLSGSGPGALVITTVGTNGFILSADSSQAGGVKWITNAAGTGTVTNIATTGPITGGPITATGTIACATCVTSAAAETLNALVIGGGLQATSVLGSLGTSTTMLHGNAAGPPSYAQASLTTDVSGILPLVNGGTGLSSGTQLNYLRVTPNTATPTLQFAALPEVNVNDYKFSAQAPGGSLTSATPATVTLTPCPLGVNGADAGHYLYVSGGTGGAAEAVLITGGTCTSGASTGNVAFTPANSHGGAWTIGPANAGCQEARNANIATGAKLHAPAGIYTFRAACTIDATGNKSFYLSGDGYANIAAYGTQISNLGTQAAFVITGAGETEIRLEHLAIIGPNTLTSGNGITCTNCIGLRLSYVYQSYSAGSGIVCNNCFAGTIDHSMFENNALYGGQFASGAYHSLRISESSFSGNCQAAAGSCAGLFISGTLSGGVELRGLIIEANGNLGASLPTFSPGIQVNNINGLSITGTHCEDNLTHCIYVGAGVTGYSIVGSYLQTSGIYIDTAINGEVRDAYPVTAFAAVNISGVVSGTAGHCRYTTSTNHRLTGTAFVFITGIGGSTVCNATAQVSAVISPTVFETAAAFSGSYTSGGTAQQTSGVVNNGTNFKMSGMDTVDTRLLFFGDLLDGTGPDIPSAATIAPAYKTQRISGAVTISTITDPAGYAGQFCTIPSPGATWVTNTAGNIGKASTAVPGQMLCWGFDGVTTFKWWPSY
jgi:hypothetical protein